MIKAAHNSFYEVFFGLYLRAHMQLVFKDVRIHNDFHDRGGSILFIGNHFSWWDGFIARHVNKQVLGRKLHLMMDEDQLSKRRFLSKLGAFSIRKNSRSAVESINYAVDVLKDPNNLLILFPQGRFESMHKHPVTFENGWFRILQKAPTHCQTVFVGALVDFFASPKPRLDIYIQNATSTDNLLQQKQKGKYTPTDQNIFASAKEAENAFNEFMNRMIEKQKG